MRLRVVVAVVALALLLPVAGSGTAVAQSRVLVKAVTPTHLGSYTTTDVRIIGSGFQPGATVTLRNPYFPRGKHFSPQSVRVDSSNQITATIHTSAPTNPVFNEVWDVIVTNPDGGEGVLAKALTLDAPPVYVAVTPYVVGRGMVTDVGIYCARCSSPIASATASGTGVRITLGGSRGGLRVAVAADAALGPRTLTLRFADGSSAGVQPYLEIVEPADLSVRVTLGSPFAVGRQGTFLVTVANSGPQKLDRAVLSVELPFSPPTGATMHLVSADGFDCSGQGSTLSCQVALGPTQTASGRIVVSVDPGVPAQSNVGFTVSGDVQAERSYANNQVTVVVPVAGGTAP